MPPPLDHPLTPFVVMPPELMPFMDMGAGPRR